MDNASTSASNDRWFAVLLGAVVTAGTCAAFLSLKAPWSLRGDNRRNIFPTVAEVYHLWTSGHIPMWTEKISAGYPLATDPTAGVFYPLHLLSFWLSSAPHLWAFDISTAIHLGLLAAGAALLLRRLGVSRLVAGVGAVLLLMSPQILWWSTFHSKFIAICWCPWVLVSADVLARSDKQWERHVVSGALVLTLQLLSGYPQLAIYMGGMAAAWVLACRSVVPVTSRLWRCLLLAACAGLLAGVQWMPTLAELPYTYRSVRPDDFGVSIAFSPILPLVDARARPFLPFSPFLGLMVLSLATIAVLRRAPRSALLAVATLVFAFLSAGNETPVYGWLLKLPGVNLFRNPTKFYVLTVFAVIFLASLGLQELWRIGTRRRAAAWLAVLLSTLALAEYGLQLRWTLTQIETGRSQPPTLEKSLRLLGKARPNLIRHSADEAPPLRVTFGGNQLVDGILPTIYGIEVFALTPRPLGSQAFTDLRLWRAPWTADRVDLFGIDRTFYPRPCPHRIRRGLAIKQAAEEYCVLSNDRAPGRYSLLSRAERVSSVDELVRRVRDDPGGPIPVMAPKSAFRTLGTGARQRGRIRVQSYRASNATMMVSASEDTLLLAREAWSKGWMAYVDGRSTPIYRAAGIFFVLPLSAGIHEVEIAYSTPGLTPGLLLSGLGIILSVGLIARGRRQRQRGTGDGICRSS